jgi:hypothetical protein
MIPSGTNSPPSAGIDSVIETLTTKRMIPPGTNSPRSAGIDSVIETLTTKRMVVPSHLRQVGDFLRVLRFPPQIKLSATIKLKYC